MSRLDKFLVYNPKKDKPTKYYSNLAEAVDDCMDVSKKENQDVLVLKVVGKCEPIQDLKLSDCLS